MQIKQSTAITNITGYLDRIERSPIIKRTNIKIKQINKPVYVAPPKIEDYNNLVVVHNQIEQYV